MIEKLQTYHAGENRSKGAYGVIFTPTLLFVYQESSELFAAKKKDLHEEE